MDCLGKRRSSLVCFHCSPTMEWMGWVTNNHWCTVPSFSGICKGISQVPTKILEISPVKTPQNPLIFCRRSNFCATKIPLTLFFFLNFCLDILVDPTRKYYGFFLGRIFPREKMSTSHILVGDTRNGPDLSASARVAAALEESGGRAPD